MTDTPRPAAMVFDWDNTLVDSWRCIQAANNATFRAFGLPEWTLEETRARVARSLRDAFPALFGERWEEAGRYYRRAYAEIHLRALAPLPRAEAMLRELHAAGLPMAVVSNKHGGFLREEAAHLGWDRWFGRLVGAGDAAADKPDPAPLLMALEATGTAPGPHVWMVGDSAVDLACAVNAGCTPVLLRSNPPAPGEFPHPPCQHFADCEALAGLVRRTMTPIS